LPPDKLVCLAIKAKRVILLFYQQNNEIIIQNRFFYKVFNYTQYKNIRVL